jgi:hypothetical protein
MKQKQLDTKKLLEEATILRNNGQEDEAIEKYERALWFFEKDDQAKEAAEVEQMIGVCLKIKNDTKRAVEKLLSAAERFKNLKDFVGLGNTYRDIGLTYFDKNDLANALTWLSKSELVLKKTNDLSAYGITQVKLGSLYVQSEQLQQGSIYISKGLANIRKAGSWFNEMTALMHMAEHRFYKKTYSEMLSLAWAALGIIFENGEEKKQERRIVELYALLAWGYLKTESPVFAQIYLEKSENLLSNMPEGVREIVERRVKLDELREELQSVNI